MLLHFQYCLIAEDVALVIAGLKSTVKHVSTYTVTCTHTIAVSLCVLAVTLHGHADSSSGCNKNELARFPAIPWYKKSQFMNIIKPL